MSKAKEIRKNHVAHYRKLVKAGLAASPIRDLAIMMENVTQELIKNNLDLKNCINLTIGDIGPQNFHIDGPKDLADELGLNPLGKMRQKLNHEIQKHRESGWNNREEPKTGYQYEATGLPNLQKEFCNFLNHYGFSYTEKDTIILGGGLPSIHAVLETISANNTHKTFVAPIPGFSVFYTQAKRLGFNFVSFQTTPAVGYCIKTNDIKELKVTKNSAVVLYLTPMNNPTSTIYDPKCLQKSINFFIKSFPKGIIILDLAYVETIDQKKAMNIMKIFKASDLLKQTIMVISMSKMFGYPRLRSASVFMKNTTMHEQLQANSQIVYASMSGAMELEALAFWKNIGKNAREKMFALFRNRQQKLILYLKDNDQKRVKNGQSPLLNFSNIHHEVPLYVYAQLNESVDPLDFFVETGVCGVPGTVFGDNPKNNMVRFAVGIEPLAKL